MGCLSLVEELKVLLGGSTKYLAFGKGLLQHKSSCTPEVELPTLHD